LRLLTMTLPNASPSPNISYTIPPRTVAERYSVNHRISAFEDWGDMYTRTHSNNKRVGSVGERMGDRLGPRDSEGGIRRSIGRR
jgi:hypothetical protein